MARGPAVLRIALQPPNEPLGVRLRLEEKETKVDFLQSMQEEIIGLLK